MNECIHDEGCQVLGEVCGEGGEGRRNWDAETVGSKGGGRKRGVEEFPHVRHVYSQLTHSRGSLRKLTWNKELEGWTRYTLTYST